MARRSIWRAPDPFNDNLFARIAMYLLANPGYHTHQSLRCVLPHSYDGKVKHICRRLAMMGYVELKAGYVLNDKWALDPQIRFTDEPQGVPDGQLVVVYGGNGQLRRAHQSGELEQRLVSKRKQLTSGPVNERIINALAGVHPTPISLYQLKAAVGISESHPELGRRLEHLAAADWVVIDVSDDPYRSSKHYHPSSLGYRCAARWTARLGATAWLQLQRAEQDGKKLKVPKPKKKPKKKEEPLAV